MRTRQTLQHNFKGDGSFGNRLTVWLIAFAVIIGIAHIGIHIQHLNKTV